jgi:putative heme iron utilization protein
MNEDHGEAVQIIAERILGLAGPGWVLAGIDPEGCDLRRDGALARAPFDRTVRDAESARVELVRLTKRARRRAADRTI